MASGYSWGGGRSRCFVYWQNFQKCYAQSEKPTDCRSMINDYLECLHHPKEIKRAQAIQAEYIRKMEQEAKESYKAVAVVSSPEVPTGVEPMKDEEPDVAK